MDLRVTVVFLASVAVVRTVVRLVVVGVTTASTILVVEVDRIVLVGVDLLPFAVVVYLTVSVRVT